MRRRLAILVSLMFVAALAACAQLHTAVKPVHFETVNPVPPGVPATLSTADFVREIEAAPRTAVLLPFADYSPENSPAVHTECHDLLQAALVKSLRAGGFESVIYGAPVTDHLLQRGVILEAAPLLEKESPRTSLLFFEIEEGEWSPVMNRRIGTLIHQNLIAIRALKGQVNCSPLNRQGIHGIGAAFGADYVIRGRITVFQSGLKWELFPHPEDVLAFYFPDPARRAPFMGVSSLRAFEWFGGGPAIPPPATIRSEENQPFRKHGRKVTPVVRLDLFIQDAATGDVVYAQSAETRALQLYSIARHGRSEPYQHFDRAVARAVDRLVDPLL
ncbi:MAG: hypothetical protein K9M82_02780 [Deltaproteobacteria bacterium]|nr:hypothetical protein [Deltaproteobacteria bacterium]